MADHSHGNHGASGGGAGRWVFLGFVLIAAYFLVTEHKAHLSAWLSSYGIWLLLLACPLMHLFMHGGHGGHRGHGGQDREETSADTKNTDGKKSDGEKKHAGGCH